MREFWQGKRVFVTGHTGFKGSWLCKILDALGAEVWGYALEPAGTPNLYGICKPRVHSVIGDIRDFDALHAAYVKARPEIVIHMAAQPLVLTSYRRPRYTYDVNVMGTVNLLECVRQSAEAATVLNVTTDKVYLNRERDEGYAEDEALDGYEPYSNSKSCSELATASFKRSFFDPAGIAVSTARSGNVIGGGDFAENRIIPDCARDAAAGKVIIVRNPRGIRPYQYVCETLFAYLLIAQRSRRDAALGAGYNIGPDEDDCVTNAELATLFCEAWGKNARWEAGARDGAHEAAILRLNCDKIKRTLGWSPIWRINRAVSETVLWYQAYYSGGGVNRVMERQIQDYLDNAVSLYIRNQ